MITRLLTHPISFFRSDLGVRFIAEGVIRASGFVITPLLSWSLGAAVFGSYLQIMSLCFAFVPVVSAGLGFTVIRKLAGQGDKQDAPKLLLIAISIITALCIFLGLFLIIWADYLTSLLALEAVEASFWLVITLPVLAWTFATEAMIGEYFRALIKARTSLYIQLMGFGLHMASLAAVLLLDVLSLKTAILSLGISKLLVIVIVLTPILLRIRKDRPKHKRPTEIWHTAISGFPFMLAGLAEWTGNLGDRLIAGHFLGSEAVAHYGAGIMMLSVIAALGAPIWWLLFPIVTSHVRENNYTACRQAVQQHTMLFAELALPVFSVTVLASNPAISLLLNTSVDNMMPVMLIIGTAILTSQLTTGWEYYVVSVSSGKRLMSATIICSAGGFSLALYLAPIWGLIGVAAGPLAGKLCLGIFFGVSANRNSFAGVAWRTRAITSLIVMNVITFFLSFVIVQLTNMQAMPLYNLMSSAAIFIIIYATGRFLFNPALRRLSS